MADTENLTKETEETYGPQDAVILNYSQTPVNYEGVPKVWLTHPDSTEEAPVLVPFTYGEAVSKTVEPDFSGGYMEVPIADGELVTGLTITKPVDLVPEKIAAGEYIAGVGPGTHQGEGVGGELDSNIKYFQVAINPDAGTVTIYKILYDLIYEDTGSYDVVIPDTINGCAVTIVC